jgi:hypothetical protein
MTNTPKVCLFSRLRQMADELQQRDDSVPHTDDEEMPEGFISSLSRSRKATKNVHCMAYQKTSRHNGRHLDG